ncbi:LppU family putative lipoprotein [Rhodococcus sovatensis]|uniref:LppU protein n=1 Tax=Rhodococcus sovatensis TaxID=1805840 RepID=A0ABZ2PFK7_9NOCA
MNINRTVVCSGFAGIAVVLIAGCTSTASTQDSVDAAASSVASAANVAASSANQAAEQARTAIEEATESATQLRPDLGGSLEVDVEVGDCILASGTLDDAAALPAPCGTPASNYRVIGKAPTNAECVSDADSYYYEELAIGGEQGALCLDVDWVIGECMDISGDIAQRVPCDGGTAPRERATEIVLDAVDADSCPDGGYAHPERKFTVCTETLTS